MINTKHRTQEVELMDDFNLHGEELQYALDKIAKINHFLGGNQLTLKGIKKLLPKTFTNLTIVDVGCGNGDMLRYIADYGKKNNLSFTLLGIDANKNTIKYAKESSTNYPNISYKCLDIFSEPYKEVKADIILTTLTLHHFKNTEIESLVPVFMKQATLGIIINDLHRSKIAYRLFETLCFLFRWSYITKHDGLISILRGFTKEDLQGFAATYQEGIHSIEWKWAFRYEWVIKHKNSSNTLLN